MLECENGAYYTGYTTNLTRRFRQHLDGTAGVKYTRSHRPVRIAQCWRLYDSVGCALKVEKMIKAGGRRVKNLILSDPSELKRIASARLGRELKLFAFDTIDVEKASRQLDASEVKTVPDPFA